MISKAKRRALCWMFPNPPVAGERPCKHAGELTGRYVVEKVARDGVGRLRLSGQATDLVLVGVRCAGCNAYADLVEVKA